MSLSSSRSYIHAESALWSLLFRMRSGILDNQFYNLSLAVQPHPTMKKASPSGKARRISKAGKPTPSNKPAAKMAASKKATQKRTAKPVATARKLPATGSLQARMVAAKKREATDCPKAEPKAAKAKSTKASLLATAAPSAMRSQRNSDFPNTYIESISVRLEDPDHPVRLTWTGPNASAQETGPFRSSPGAGLRGLNCDDPATSRRPGSTCTPKGTFSVTGFAPQLNSHPEAKDVTWFLPARGIALHYYPSVPKFPASHGCVRLETRRIAQLIQNNSRVGITSVVVDGTWTKPAQQH